MPYVDGFVIPIPTKKLKAYRKLALHIRGRVQVHAGGIWRHF